MLLNLSPERPYSLIVESILEKSKRDMKNNLLQKPKKGLFIGLLVFTCLALVLLAIFLWWVPYVGLKNIHPYMPHILAGLFASVLILVFLGVLVLIFTIIRGRDIVFLKRIRGVVIKFLFPLLIGVGKLFGIPKEELQRSFIDINNQLVLAQASKMRPNHLLLLMPHCVQNYDCKIKVIADPNNCERCGKCQMKDLLELAEAYHVSLSVATGGSLARRIVVRNRPHIIIACACERELSSGIQDAYPTPVFGILNERPNGPCYNTKVNIEIIEETMGYFLKV